MGIEKGKKISAEIHYFLISQVPENLDKPHFYYAIEKQVDNLIITRILDEFNEKFWTHFVLIRTKNKVFC